MENVLGGFCRKMENVLGGFCREMENVMAYMISIHIQKRFLNGQDQTQSFTRQTDVPIPNRTDC